MTTAIRRRPRRSNTLKDLQRLLGVAGTAHEDRKDRLQAHAALLVDTEAAAWSNYWKIRTLSLQATGMGFKLVPNSRVFHVLEERPGAFGAALADDGDVGNALRHLKALGLLNNATPQDRRLATLSKKALNEQIMAQRDVDLAWLAAVEAVENVERDRRRIAKRRVKLFCQTLEENRHKLRHDPWLAAAEAVENLRIDFWADWMPLVNEHEREPSWQAIASALEAMGVEERVRLHQDAVARKQARSEEPAEQEALLVKVKKTFKRGVFDGTRAGNNEKFNPLGLDDNGVDDYEPYGSEGDDG